MRLPNIKDSAWEWDMHNGFIAIGVQPMWDITIKCGWININCYPTEKSCAIANLEMPALDDEVEAKLLAEQSALWLEHKLLLTKSIE